MDLTKNWNDTTLRGMNTEAVSSEVAAKPELKSNGLGLAALIIGIIALVFAFIPLIQVFGGFAAFVGSVLGLVGLFLKGRKKGVAIAGTIISILAVILSISLSALYAQSFVDAVSTSVQESQSTTEILSGGDDDTSSGTSTDGDRGTRDNPLPMGSTITVGPAGSPEWEITVGPVLLNANDAIAAENRFNDPPEPGLQYAMLTLNVTYVGETSATPWVNLDWDYVGADSVTYRSSDFPVVAPNSFRDINELFPGGSGSGNIVIAIPSDSASAGTWRIGGSFFGEKIFFAAE